ncbi:MAG: sulfite exporter TauE/SafE family protein, partial [Phycisphaerae bacterium]|nr:sulfite exporter TauE/SafE family protein [Phycisphaerae bacterium]
NINIKPDTFAPSILIERLKNLGYIETARKTFPLHLKIALLLATCSIIGTVTAVFVAVNIPVLWLKIYIGSLITIMGLVILLFKNHKFRFSPKRIFLLGLIASANKGMSGGGYGPVVTSGQLLTGIEGKSAVGITSLAEGLTCFVGVICYMVLAEKNIAWHLAPYITCGAVLSVPLSAKSVKLITTENLKWIIALVTTLLGLFTLTKTIMAI